MSRQLHCPHCCSTARPGEARGWHNRKGPRPLLQARHNLDPWAPYPKWADHPYRVRRDDGQWVYVAEPYEIHPDEAFDDFAYLAEHGWQVTLLGEGRHHPATIAVIIGPAEA